MLTIETWRYNAAISACGRGEDWHAFRLFSLKLWHWQIWEPTVSSKCISTAVAIFVQGCWFQNLAEWAHGSWTLHPFDTRCFLSPSCSRGVHMHAYGWRKLLLLWGELLRDRYVFRLLRVWWRWQARMLEAPTRSHRPVYAEQFRSMLLDTVLQPPPSNLGPEICKSYVLGELKPRWTAEFEMARHRGRQGAWFHQRTNIVSVYVFGFGKQLRW